MGVSSQELSRMVGGGAPIVDTEQIDWQIVPIIGDFTAEMDGDFTIEERAAEIIRAVDSNPQYQNEGRMANPSTFFAKFAVGSLRYLSESRILRSMSGENREIKDFSAYRRHKIAAIAGHLGLIEIFDQYIATQPRGDSDIFEELVHTAIRAEAAVVNGHHSIDQIKVDSTKFIRGLIGEWLAGHILKVKGFPIRRATPREDARGRDLFVLGEYDEREISIQVKSQLDRSSRIRVSENPKHAADIDVVIPFPADDRRRVSFTRSEDDTRAFINSVRGKTSARRSRGYQTVRRHRCPHR